MKVWITKYALTEGIQEKDAEPGIGPHMICTGDGFSRQSFFRNDWHPTREAAVKRAESMRLKKIESLKKQIEKLETLKF